MDELIITAIKQYGLELTAIAFIIIFILYKNWLTVRAIRKATSQIIKTQLQLVSLLTEIRDILKKYEY